MKKLISFTLLLLLITPCLRAQRKEISQARSYLKSGKDLDKAEKLITELFSKDSVNRSNPKLHVLLYQIVQKQYSIGNEKLYLKEKYDTASLFNLTKRMFALAETIDTLDAMPDKKGRVVLDYRKKHASELDGYRPNLFNGGIYFVRKNDYQTAYTFFDAYLDCGRQPLFEQYDYNNTDSKMPLAAYWAVYCGFKLGNPNRTLHYYDIARRDTSRLRYLLRYAAEAYNRLGCDSAYVNTLREGFDRYPKFKYFFPRLIDYYVGKDRVDRASVIADRALAVDNRDALFLLAKSTLLLNMGKDDACIAISDTLIHINDTIPDAYYNAGTAYLNKIVKIEKQAVNTRKDRMLIKELYRLACPYMEKYRELMPADKSKWASALYRIYLNLNQGKKFEEIDKVLNTK